MKTKGDFTVQCPCKLLSIPARFGGDNQRLFGLWDIVNRFALDDLLTILQMLHDALRACECAKSVRGGGATLSDDFFHGLDGLLARAEKTCFAINYLDAYTKIGTARMHVAARLTHLTDISSVSVEIRNVIESIFHNSYKQSYLLVWEQRAAYVDNAALFGSEVRAAFPSACMDIREAGNCLAADCNTAAVFHLMRAVEWGLRALCVSVGVKRIPRSKKPGNKKFFPLDYSEWEKILDELQDRIDQKMLRLTRGKIKQREQEFYFPLLAEVRGFKEAFRNHVMHTRGGYSAQDADAVYDHVKRFMMLLATRIRER